MRVLYGCELTVVVKRPTPTLCLVDAYPDRRQDVVGEQPLSPPLPLATTADAFGNILTWCLLPPDETTFLPDGIITDTGLPDVRDRLPAQAPRSVAA